MNSAVWERDIFAAVNALAGSRLADYKDGKALFMTASPPESPTPYLIIEDPVIETTPATGGYFEDVTVTMLLYCERQDAEAIRTANAIVNDLAAHFSPANQPMPQVSGFPLMFDESSEIPTRDETKYALSASFTQNLVVSP